MSVSLDRELAQDRALRDAALELVKADIANLKADASAESLASRFATRMTEGAADLYEEAAEKAADNKGILAILVTAIFVWFARNPILDLLLPDEASEAGDEQEQSPEPTGVLEGFEE